MTLGQESRRDDLRPSPALSCYMGTGQDGTRGSGTRLSCGDFSNYWRRRLALCLQRGNADMIQDKVAAIIGQTPLLSVCVDLLH